MLIGNSELVQGVKEIDVRIAVQITVLIKYKSHTIGWKQTER